jgi:hypothetical protein
MMQHLLFDDLRPGVVTLAWSGLNNRKIPFGLQAARFEMSFDLQIRTEGR